MADTTEISDQTEQHPITAKPSLTGNEALQPTRVTLNPFTSIKAHIALPDPTKPNPFLCKSVPEEKSQNVENPFLKKNAPPTRKPPAFQSTDLGRRVNVFFDSSSNTTTAPFSAAQSEFGHFVEGGNDFEDEDDLPADSTTSTATTTTATGTFANGFTDAVDDASSDEYDIQGTFAGGFEDTEDDDQDMTFDVYGNSPNFTNDSLELDYSGNSEFAGVDEEEVVQGQQPLRSGIANDLNLNTWGLAGLDATESLELDDVDEIEEVIIDTSEDEETYLGGDPCSINIPNFTIDTSAMSSGVKRSIAEAGITSPSTKSKKNKKKSRKRARVSGEPNSSRFCPAEIWSRPGMKKYWFNRYELFSKYDEGIKLDLESWFSVTPEKIAQEISKKVALTCPTNGIIIDAFCGCGGNTIQFAKSGRKVIAIDIDPVKIENAKHNARIYEVEENITFIVADFMAVAPVLKADVVFLSPPWGGPEYTDCAIFDLETMIPVNGITVFELAQKISPNVAYYVPRHTDTEQLMKLAGPGNSVEVQRNYYEGRVKAITAYYGNLINTGSLE